tara:strand:+ start:105 stop:479 length:375 start_codon:yes stop_codon:yes gene_type:complete
VDNLSVFLFAIAGISTLVGAFYLMASAGMSREVQDYNWHPMKDGGPESPEFKKYMRTVTKRVHPEMVDVEPGEELMGVTFEKKDSCSLEEYKDLQARIEILRAELEGGDEDDDDDGDVPAVVRR